jgi:aminoglycoside/choline kinase family phosphotransferase
MADILQDISQLYQDWQGKSATEIQTLRQAGSNRMYFRIKAEHQPVIATHNPSNVAENNAFIQFSRHFTAKQLPVPDILYVDQDMRTYFQCDLGNESLYDIMVREGFSERVFDLYRKTCHQLARLQIEGGKNLDYNHCIATKSFDKQAIYSGLLYFLYYFVRALDMPYDKNALLNDFDILSSYLMQEEQKYFMHRDCQSRNIMVKDERVYFIDYQGGMQGALQYDMASLLWQARASLPYEWRDELLHYYFEQANALLGHSLNKHDFFDSYDGFVLIRMLQTLGAYGFRGLFERKHYFIASIPFALKNLAWFMQHKKLPIRLPELHKLLLAITDEKIITRFDIPKAGDDCPLVVRIGSFSYKAGIPEDDSGNGGGFVFDCRGLLNPGRFEAYKTLTGRDQPVQEFLLHKTQMSTFLQHVYSLVDISVEDYMKRGFSSLTVHFGCTGGQHRSVYAADKLAQHLQEKFNVQTIVFHREQEKKNWINQPYG